MNLPPRKPGEIPFQTETDRAFTRIDLMAVIVVLLFVGGWLALAYTGENGRIAQCTRNLSTLADRSLNLNRKCSHNLPTLFPHDLMVTVASSHKAPTMFQRRGNLWEHFL